MTFAEFKTMLEKEGIKDADDLVFLGRGPTHLTSVLTVKCANTTRRNPVRTVPTAYVQLAP